MANNKIRIKAHESFYIREGWLTKGIKAVEKDEYILSDINRAVDELGVGSNMVKSIRYWLQATGLTMEGIGDKSKRKQNLTENFGKIIVEKDEYFEELGTLFLLHYNLVKNKENATSWNLFFNNIKVTEMTKSIMYSCLENELLNIDPELKISEKSLQDDCNCIIKTYFSDKGDVLNPEDNMICPLSNLGLITKSKSKNKEDIIEKAIPKKKDLDKLIILYVIVDNLNNRNSISIKDLIEEDNNIGKVFNLDKNRINEYIDMLQDEGYVTVTRTAGLNMIYPKELSLKSILEKYYEEV